MKKILVLSDLHIPTRMITFPYDKISSHIDNIDLIFGLITINGKTIDTEIIQI